MQWNRIKTRVNFNTSIKQSFVVLDGKNITLCSIIKL